MHVGDWYVVVVGLVYKGSHPPGINIKYQGPHEVGYSQRQYIGLIPVPTWYGTSDNTVYILDLYQFRS
jgi:hypothetical protein